MIKTTHSLRTISVPLEIKAFDDASRTFEGLAATFDPDLGGDKILPGAFKRSIANWKKSKSRAHNLLDSHNDRTIFSVLGGLVDAEETDAGLLGKWEFLDNAQGNAAHFLVKSKRVDRMSIGYVPVKTDPPTQVDQQAGIWRYLKEINWQETSLVLFPMNPAASIDFASVKSLLGLEEGLPRDLTEDEVKELTSLDTMIRARLVTAPGNPDPDPGLAPEDATRLLVEAKARGLLLSRLGL